MNTKRTAKRTVKTFLVQWTFLKFYKLRITIWMFCQLYTISMYIFDEQTNVNVFRKNVQYVQYQSSLFHSYRKDTDIPTKVYVYKVGQVLQISIQTFEKQFFRSICNIPNKCKYLLSRMLLLKLRLVKLFFTLKFLYTTVGSK